MVSQDHMIRESCDFMARRSSSTLPSYKFCGNRHFGIRDIMVFICHVTLQDQVIKVLIKWLYSRKSLKTSQHPTRFVSYRHCGSGYIIVLFCHVIFQDRVIKGSCDLITSSSSLQITTLPNFGAICIAVVDILALEEQDSTCSRLNLLLLFFSKGHGLQAHDIPW